MVCYAQRLITMTCIAFVAFLLLGKAVTHSLDVASLVVSVSAVVAGAALAAAIAFVSFRSVRRRRALAGGCVACTFKCQHAMTEARPTRVWLVSTVDRAASGQVAALIPLAPPAQSAPLTPQAVPQWPDRPLRAPTPVCVPVPRDPAGQRERVPAR